MRYLIVLLLAGCTHAVTLHPRGGGDQATGTLNDGSQHISIQLRGDTYEGRYVTTGRGSQQATALLTGRGGTLRCELTIEIISGGNGVCVDAQGRTYDMLIK